MTTTAAWRRLERCILDGEPFTIEVLDTGGGYRVRVRFAEQTPIDDGDRTWPTLEEARGRAYQLADEAVEQTLR